MHVFFVTKVLKLWNTLQLGCVFSRELWSAVLRKLQLDHTITVRHDNVFVWWLRERKSVPKIGRAGFDSMFFLISWSIWKERNARTFGDPSTQALRQIEKASTSYMSISSVLSVLYPARDHSRASSKIV